MLELEIITQHLRLGEPEATEAADILDTYSNAARRQVENRTARTLYATAGEIPTDAETGEPTDDSALVLDDDITTAMLLYIEYLFDRPATDELLKTFEDLIAPYRHYQIY